MGKAAAIASTASIGFRSRRQPKPVASSSVAPHHRASGCKRTTILRQSARKLAESANAGGRKFRLEKLGVVKKWAISCVSYAHFVLSGVYFACKGSGVRVPPSPPSKTPDSFRDFGVFVFRCKTKQSAALAEADLA
jgi:hypothetical protein